MTSPTEAYKARVATALVEKLGLVKITPTSKDYAFSSPVWDDDYEKVIGKQKNNIQPELDEAQAAILKATADYLDALVGEDEQFDPHFSEDYHGHRRSGRNHLKAELRQTIDQLRKP